MDKLKVLTKQASILCEHKLGKVNLANSQNLVKINGNPVLVKKDTEGRSIIGCPNAGITIKPCTNTLPFTEIAIGHSDFIRINKKPICLETITGITDGTPPGIVKYKVHHPGQNLVSQI